MAPPGAGALSQVNQAPGDRIVVADREQMLRVLMNLLRNALDALGAAGAQPGQDPTVLFTALRRAGRIVIEVRDTGPGVPERARKTLFQPFLGSSRQGGTGLGLAIAAELVAGHGGDIRLLDAGEDGGATFRIELPDRPAQRRAIAAGGD